MTPPPKPPPEPPFDANDPPRRRAWQPPASAPSPLSAKAPPPKPPARASVGSAGNVNAKRAARPAAARVPTMPPASPARATSRVRGSFRAPGGRRGPALISKGERALFWTLLAAVLAMSIFLARYRARVDAHFQARAMAVPLDAAGATASHAPLLLYLANDDTGALVERPLSFPVPEDANTRARVVLEKLLAEYAAPDSPHPLQPAAPGVENVDEVYLSPVPGGRGQLAVVDLTPAFVHRHPSGIEPETLTLLSMIATLHANLPSVAQVRFLVDGEPRPTLAGHADLTRTYLAGATQIAPSEAFTSRAMQP